MDWSLLDCGRSGHLTYAPAEPDVRRQLVARAESGEAWRCLRCGAYVTGEPLMSGPAAEAPVVRRGKEVRSTFILRVFAVERLVRALAVGVLAFVVWRFEYARETIEQAFNRERPVLRTLFHQFGYNIDNSKLVGLLQHALRLSPTTIKLVAIGLTGYAVIEVIEGVGLWQAKRWGEYFAMVATSLGLPFEIYDLVSRVSLTGTILLAINLTLVLYLVITKRLFGVRGGKRAYDARLRSESIMDAAINAAAARREPGPPAAPGPDPGHATAEADANPAHATADADPARTTAEANANPAHATADTNPAHATADANPAHATADANPAHATAETDTNPAHATADADADPARAAP